MPPADSSLRDCEFELLARRPSRARFCHTALAVESWRQQLTLVPRAGFFAGADKEERVTNVWVLMGVPQEGLYPDRHTGQRGWVGGITPLELQCCWSEVAQMRGGRLEVESQARCGGKQGSENRKGNGTAFYSM